METLRIILTVILVISVSALFIWQRIRINDLETGISQKNREIIRLTHDIVSLQREANERRMSNRSVEVRHFNNTLDVEWPHPGHVVHTGDRDPDIGRLSDNDRELLEMLRRGGPFTVEKKARIVKQDSFFD